MIYIQRSLEWSPGPPSAAAAYPVPGSKQVNTNGRGAVVWIPPGLPARRGVPMGGLRALGPRPPKLMMDPLDRSTWQRPYRFT